MRPSARALATDVGPHALLSQCFLAAALSKLGNAVGMNVLGGILNDALREDCRDLPKQGLTTNSFNFKTTMFTCRPRTRTHQRAHTYASRDPCFAWLRQAHRSHTDADGEHCRRRRAAAALAAVG